ncbi:AraC-like DNA-binding protein [Chitinophaga niastensis]|uniref:AraC-like DNA-binding protein n=1 Tax=Chitinophaga niastensis TaxID=536980 RepID=A0A2P8HUT8_CHINA|nr:response regulator transcription factor [Chitinophaga niastensis]PSL49991.1 AraC-like DNA-binding protein [Chitinophaga niastensis]
MEKYNLISIISLIAFFITLLLNLFLLTVKTKNRLSNALLAFCFLSNAIDMSIYFVYKFADQYPNLAMLRGNMGLLGAPLLYLYMVSVCYSDFKLKPKHLLHAIPFLLGILVVTPRYYLADLPAKDVFLAHFSEMPEIKFTYLLGHAQTISYSIAMFVLLRKYKKIFLENYANIAMYSYHWLFQLALVTAIIHGIVILQSTFMFAGYKHTFTIVQIIVTLTFLSLLCWIVLKTMYNPDLFRGIDSRLPLVKEIVPEPAANNIQEKTEKEPETNVKAQIDELKKHMAEEEPYLEPSLTVQDLAKQIKMPVRDLSILINHHMNQHFFDFINEYRIKRAMKMLRDSTKNELNIQEILYEVGFNSKSSFNTAFKKHANSTPTQYRNSSL